MAKLKSKSKSKSKEIVVALICLGVVVLIIAAFIAKYKFDEYNDKFVMEQTLADVTKLYNGFIIATPKQEELAYKPINSCGYKNNKGAIGYTCQTKASIRYADQSSNLTEYFTYVDQAIDLNTFSIIEKGVPQNFKDEIYGSYKIKHKMTGSECQIRGSANGSKVRFTFECSRDTYFQLYTFEDDRIDERFYSD